MSVQTALTATTAVYAFSADPITFGHINIVERMAATFSRCVVGIGRNPTKRYLFSLEERARLARAVLAHLANVEVMAFDGMVVDFAYEQGASVIVKGVRNSQDLDYEHTLHHVGVSQQMGIDTHLLFAEPKLAHVSSSVVKAMQLEHGFIQEYVPAMVKAALEAKLSGQLIIGITGHIASGKSTLAQELVAVGSRQGNSVHHIDVDRLAHRVLAGDGMGEPIYARLKREAVALLGSAIINDGTLDRARIAEKIFADAEARMAFNALLEKPLSLQLRRALKEKRGLILLESALLADLHLLALCNFRCILCEVDKESQLHRMQERGYSALQMQQRVTAQQTTEEKMQLIESAINQQRFGQCWHYQSGHDDADALLRSIMSGCPEFQILQELVQ